MRAFHPAALALAATVTLAAGAASAETPAPEGARVYIANLSNGDVVSSPFLVQFGIEGMEVVPAGDETPNTGHHHLLINTTLEGDALADPIPFDDNHRHFGGGQTEVELELEPGEYTLQLVLGDWAHVPHVPPVMSEPVTITVE
jgi:hypothetical protein